MGEAESIQDYYKNIIKVVNEMKAFGEEIKDSGIVKKILVSSPPKIYSMVSLIKERKDISTMNI